MSDYVQQLWQDRATQEMQQSRFTRIFGWTLGVAAATSLVAFLTRDYWYPYVAPYLYY